jgi:DNA primase
MNKLTDLDTLKAQIKPRLKEFLEENDIEISPGGMFRCISKMHLDENASCKLLPDLNNEQYFCYGCHATGDIFSANHELNEAPMHGIEFIKDNVYKLADKYSIHYESMEFSEEQLEAMELYRFTKTVSDLLILKDEQGNPINWTNEHALARGWKPGVCERLRISTIKNYQLFLKDIQAATGLTQEQIIERDIKPDLFYDDVITITLFDERGRPVGFTGRWLKYEKKPDSKRPKYRNTHRNSIFEKSKTLYGIHLCRNQKHRRLDIFEGNGSFITAYGEGHTSCAALCGTSISPDQIDLIQRFGFTYINLVLDPDDAGRRVLTKHIEALSGREGLKVTATLLPPDSEASDPDDYIQENGLQAFFKIKTISAFDYMVKEQWIKGSGAKDPVSFITKMIRVIENTPNRIERGQQIRSLAEITETNEEDIRDEMERIISISTDDIKSKLHKEIDRARSADDILAIVDTFATDIKSSVGTKSERIALGFDECMEGFENLMKILKNKKPGIQGWESGYKILDMKLSGIPKPMGLDDSGAIIPIPGALMGIAGAPQHCKSTIVQNLAVNLAMKNDDICVLFFSLDDARERVFERILSQVSGVSWRSVTRRIAPTNDEILKIGGAASTMLDLMKSGRLIVKDHSVGSSFPVLKRWVELTKEQTDRPLLVVIDSFHKIGVASDESQLSEFARAKAHSQKCKAMVQTHNISILATLEMNKSQSIGTEPNLSHITETRKIEYDFDVIATVYNEYYDLGGQTQYILQDSVTREKKPLIKFNIKKSKEGGAGPIVFSLDQANFQLDCFSVDEINSMIGQEDVNPTIADDSLTIYPASSRSYAPNDEDFSL